MYIIKAERMILKYTIKLQEIKKSSEKKKN